MVASSSSSASSSEESGGRVDAHRALKPRGKEGGRMEKRWVRNVSVYASRIVFPSLRMSWMS